MAISTVWPAVSRGEEVWIASNEHFQARRYFGSLGGVKDFMRTRYPHSQTEWEEMAFDNNDGDNINLDASNRRDQMKALSNCRVISGLMIRMSGEPLWSAPGTHSYQDTGWRVWRAQ